MNALLEADSLTVKFGALVAVKNVSFVLPTGEVTALIGPNGAGKTTCLNVLSGIQKPTSGRLLFEGVDIASVPPHHRYGIGRTFQIVELFGELTVLENVLVGMHRHLRGGLAYAAVGAHHFGQAHRTAKDRAGSLLEKVGLSRMAHLPASNLPLGQQRLLEFARALAGSPKLLLLDEVASGLSQAELVDFAALVRGVADDHVTVLLVEHNMRFVNDVADHVVVLNFGEVLFSGSLEDGLRNEAVIGAYLGGGA